MRREYLMLLVLGCGGAAEAQTLAEAWRLGGMVMPESAYFDSGTGRIVVSQIGTFGPDAGADGKLSLVSPAGEAIEADWVTGLIDPKGMASTGGKLYVADANGLVVVDMAGGAVEQVLEMPGAMLLNDVTVGDDGAIYVSDTFGGGIYRLKDGAVDQVVAAGGVPFPNGVFADGGQIVVGSMAEDMDMQTFEVKAPGGLMILDPATGALTPVAGTEGTAQVDGITRMGDWLLYNHNGSGRIMGVRDGVMTELGETRPGAADMGTTGDLLVIPFLESGEVVAYRIE